MKSFSLFLSPKRQIESQEDGQAGVKTTPAFLFGFLSLFSAAQLGASQLFQPSPFPGGLQLLQEASSPAHTAQLQLGLKVLTCE